MIDFFFCMNRNCLNGKTVLVPLLVTFCFGVTAPIIVHAKVPCWNLNPRANPADVFDPENPAPYFNAKNIRPLDDSSPLRAEIEKVDLTKPSGSFRVFRVPNSPSHGWVIFSNDKVYFTTDLEKFGKGQFFALESPAERHLVLDLESRLVPVKTGVRNNRHYFQAVKNEKIRRLVMYESAKYNANTDAFVAWESSIKQPHARLEYDLLEVEVSVTEDDQILLSTPIKESWRRLHKLRGTPFDHIVGVHAEGSPTTPFLVYAKAIANYLIPIAESFFGLNGKAHDVRAHIRGFLRMPKSSWIWFATTFQLILEKYESSSSTEKEKQDTIEKIKFVVDLADRASGAVQAISNFKMSELSEDKEEVDRLIKLLFDFNESKDMVPLFLTPQQLNQLSLSEITAQYEKVHANYKQNKLDAMVATVLRNRDGFFQEIEDGHQYLLQLLQARQPSVTQTGATK